MDFVPYISKPFDPVNQFVGQRIVRLPWISGLIERTWDQKKFDDWSYVMEDANQAMNKPHIHHNNG